MAFAFVGKSAQDYKDAVSGGTFTKTGCTAGNLLVLTLALVPNFTTNPTAALSAPSGWSAAIAPTGAGGNSDLWKPVVGIFYKIATAGTNTAVCTGWPAGSYAEGDISEYSFSGSVALDTTNSVSTSTNTNTSGSTGSATNSAATALAIVIGNPADNSSAISSMSAPPATGYTGISNDPSPALHLAYSSGYKILSAAAAQSASWTWAGNANFAAAIALFVEVASGISPTGIASAEAMGAPGVSATVAPTGVASAQAMGSPSVAGSVVPTGIATAEALGTPSVAGGIAPGGIASGQAFGAPALAAAITASGIASGEAFGVPVVAAAGLFPVGIASAEAFGVPALAARIAPVSISSSEAFGRPTVGSSVPPEPESSGGGIDPDEPRERAEPFYRYTPPQRRIAPQRQKQEARADEQGATQPKAAPEGQSRTQPQTALAEALARAGMSSSLFQEQALQRLEVQRQAEAVRIELARVAAAALAEEEDEVAALLLLL